MVTQFCAFGQRGLPLTGSHLISQEVNLGPEGPAMP
jgi:hypothetical protein